MALPAAAILLVAATPLPASCEEPPRAGGFLVQCYDPEPALANATNATESFRSSLLPLLAALPPAAAPTGFASLRSDGRAFVRGMCFGDATVPPSDCLACLTVAARNITSVCRATTRRAGIWTEGCFVAYADTNSSSPDENAFRERVFLRGSDCAATSYYSYYLHAWLVDNMVRPAALSAAANISAPRMLATADAATPTGCSVRSTVHVLAQCARDRPAAECVSCLQDSARSVDWDVDADQRDDGGVTAAVVGFNCYLRFDVSTSVQTDLFPFIILGGLLFGALVLTFASCCFCRS